MESVDEIIIENVILLTLLNDVMKVGLILMMQLLWVIDLDGQFHTSSKKVWSINVKDSFEIYTSIPEDYAPALKYDVIYYCDANLKSGKLLRELIKENKQLSQKGKFIFVGIGHIGNYHVLRRRDFILPFINQKDTIPKSPQYGHVRDFYMYLTTELIPTIQASWSCSGKKTILGHSLGGLFVFYCLFQNTGVFSNYIALSPALWIDDYKIYHFNTLKSSVDGMSYLYLSAGSKETINRILYGANSMNEFLKTKQYTNLTFEFQVHPGKTHNTQIEESLKYVFNKL